MSNAVQWDPNEYNDRDVDDEWFECETYEDGALDDEEFFESIDGFVMEHNYYGEINNIVLNHPDITCAEATQLYEFKRKVNGVSGNWKQIDFEKLRPFFLWKPVEAIKKTFAVTTQFVETVWYNTPRLPLRRHFKS